MFTGIVEEMGRVETATPSGISVRASKVMEDLSLGASINVNGVCLTVTRLDQRSFDVDVVPETLRRTNLGSLEAGSSVNLERPVPAAGRLDGHVVQGHVDGTGRIESVRVDGTALLVRVALRPELLRYVVQKGFVAVDGISLTVVDCYRDGFSFTVIPFTRNETTLGLREVGDLVNIEVDILAKYVERLAGPNLNITTKPTESPTTPDKQR